jgi:hypothetical protein
MKKILFVFVLAVILATGTAFADHPDGLGIGVVGGIGWGGFNGGGAYGLSLKIPSIPVYWAVNLGFGSNYFRVGLTGDYYMIDQVLVKDIGLHWFLGLGGFFNFYSYSDKWNGIEDYNHTHMNFGGRVPIGLSWQPVKLLEIFLDVAPSLGVGLNSGWEVKNSTGVVVAKEDSSGGFFWGIPLEIGLRLWF